MKVDYNKDHMYVKGRVPDRTAAVLLDLLCEKDEPLHGGVEVKGIQYKIDKRPHILSDIRYNAVA